MSSILIAIGLVAVAATLLLACLGILTVVWWVKTPRSPLVDASNIINRIRLWWFCLSRPELFIGIFPWLRNDELENVSHLTVLPKTPLDI